MGALLLLPITQWEKEQNMELSEYTIKQVLENEDHFSDFENNDNYEKLSDCDFEEAYNNSLNESGDIDVAAYSYPPSQLLYAVDPIAYNCGLSDFTDAFIKGNDDILEDNIGDYWRKV